MGKKGGEWGIVGKKGGECEGEWGRKGRVWGIVGKSVGDSGEKGRVCVVHTHRALHIDSSSAHKGREVLVIDIA